MLSHTPPCGENSELLYNDPYSNENRNSWSIIHSMTFDIQCTIEIIWSYNVMKQTYSKVIGIFHWHIFSTLSMVILSIYVLPINNAVHCKCIMEYLKNLQMIYIYNAIYKYNEEKARYEMLNCKFISASFSLKLHIRYICYSIWRLTSYQGHGYSMCKMETVPVEWCCSCTM